jgi:gliding motility-associated lipoprotein GldD
MRSLHLIITIAIGIIAVSCGGDTVFSPKPRAYPRVEYPEKAYRSFDEDYCNFTFEYPVYAEIQQDSNFFDEKPSHPCWFDIYIPGFDSRLHCSYYPISKGQDLEKFKSDAFELADWHNKKANYIEERRIEKPNNVSGFAFFIEGPAASPFQFYLTDSTHHFLRGALYFNTQVRPDSLAPIYDFVKEDIFRMIDTFSWEQE